MSYLNINYSTLEDAWGTNFEKQKRKKKSPLCDLYEKKNAKIYKPYKTVQNSKHVKPIYVDDDYTKYYGYSDGVPSNKKHNLSKYKLKFPYKKQTPRYVYDEDDSDIDEENDDHQERVYEEKISSKHPKTKQRRKPTMKSNFSYIDEDSKIKTMQPIIEEESEDDSPSYLRYSKQQRNDDNTQQTYIYHEQDDDSDDEFDRYLKPPKHENTREEDSEDEYHSVLQSVYEEHRSVEPSFKKKNIKKKNNMIEEELFNNDKQRKIKSRQRDSNERVLLDFILYTISGILLIFIMEQFILIGTKIKTTL